MRKPSPGRKLRIAAGYLVLFALTFFAGHRSNIDALRIGAFLFLVGAFAFGRQAFEEYDAQTHSREWTEGSTTLEGTTLRHERGGRERWRIDVRDIRLVGEFTTALGPFTEDWFVVFMTRKSDKYFEAPVGAIIDRIPEIGNQLETELVLELFASTDNASRVVWPENLAGEPFINF